MNKSHRRLTDRAILIGWSMAGLFLWAFPAAAQVVDRLPNLRALPATDIGLSGAKLKFSTTTWNSGSGPLELVAGPVDTGSGKQQVHQRVYLSDGSHFDHFAGWVQWHQAHNHFHFDDYALYTLQPVNAPGGSARTGSKTTFCIMDTDRINGSLPGTPSVAFYSTCGSQIQGMSVGWGDTYGYWLAGQELDVTGNPYGMYQLKIEVDPKMLLLETHENDNVSCVLLDIQSSGVRVLDNSGSCNLVTDITPKSARLGETVTVNITGYGFTNSSKVSFEGGTGPRPAATVNSVSDTSTVDTITASVTVPYKKQLGRNPVWDVKISTGGILPDAFTVLK